MELELKFALIPQELKHLSRQLARIPLTGKRKPKRQTLHNTYYDTPEHSLQNQRIALRVRQLGTAAHPQWVQTLKTGGAANSALSQRGEWEAALQTAQLSHALLAQTPWAELDPKGTLFHSLAPVFTTTFERMSWEITLEDAAVELALDVGSVYMDGHSTPLCELEIELLHGEPDTLFEVAALISQHISLLPLHMSKAERAYRLAQGTLHAPMRARPPELHAGLPFAALAQTVLRECFLQFTANLYTVRSSEAPEVLHQARVGWRRFKSALKLFKQHGADSGLGTLAALQPLLLHMNALRDLDVVTNEVLPLYASAYHAGVAQRLAHWQELDGALAQERQTQRAALLQCLAEPVVGQALVHITAWLETGTITLAQTLGKQGTRTPAKWVRRRMEKLAMELASGQLQAREMQDLHRLRILAKRLRYGVENMRPLLPKKRAARWLRSATQLQTHVGWERDQQQAIALAQRLNGPAEIIAFLRGAAFATAQAGAAPA